MNDGDQVEGIARLGAPRPERTHTRALVRRANALPQHSRTVHIPERGRIRGLFCYFYYVFFFLTFSWFERKMLGSFGRKDSVFKCLIRRLFALGESYLVIREKDIVFFDV